eukprot:6912176-Prymnesium_polylepis.1
MQSAVVGRTYAMYGRNRLNIREYSRTFANIREYSRIFANMFGQYPRILGPIFANIRESIHEHSQTHRLSAYIHAEIRGTRNGGARLYGVF